MKKVLFMLLFIGMMLTITGCKEEETEANKEDQFIVGLECSYAPFNWTETEKTAYNYPISGTKLYADGYDVQIAKAVASSLGKVLVIKPIEWDGLIPALGSGQIDAIIAGMSPTDERKIDVDFTESYYTSTHVIVLEKTSKYVNAKKLNDFNDAVFIGQISTLYDKLIDQLQGVTHNNPLNTVPEIITAITSGRCDATIVEEPVAKGIIGQNPSLTYIKLEEKFNVEESDIIVSIAVSKGQTELVEQINGILSGITTTVREKLMEQAISRAKQ